MPRPAAPSAPISVEKLIGADLQKLWANPQFGGLAGGLYQRRGFMAPKFLHPGAVLFVGINPSYSEADKDLIYYDGTAGTHPYFKRFRELAERAQTPWSHLDMLFVRETEQKAIDKLLQQDRGVDFVWPQLQLAQRLLDAAQPAAIVVCNTKARQFLGLDKGDDGTNAWLDLAARAEGRLAWDEALGTYRYGRIPTFFSGMLTGQRALDKGSFERLGWHLRRALKAGL